MTFLTTFMVLAFLGLIDSGFLYYKYKKKHPLSCPLHFDCNVVINSRWGKFFGVKNELWGILYYGCLLSAETVFYFYPSIFYFNYAFFFLTLVAVFYSAWLVYIQLVRLKEYCLYCLLSALVNVLLFLNAFKLFI